jgi:aspartate/methionine/tyrosine aminotransferase
MTAALLNPLVTRLSPPPIPAVQAWGRSYAGGHGPLIDLSQAVPGYPPHPDMLRWLGEAASSAAYANYGPIEGETILRDAYAAHVSELYGAAISGHNIHITSGCNQAFICAAMVVAEAGETVLVSDPFYFNHETTLSMLGIKTGFVACDAENGFVPTVEAVEKALVPGVRALALVTPNNPTGAVYSPERLKAIFAACRKHGIWLILDETYRDFLADGAGAPHGLFNESSWEDNLIQLYSFSKSFCIPGHRLGSVTAGETVVTEIAKIMDNLQICAPPLGPGRRCQGHSGAWRMESRQPRRNRHPRRCAETGDEQAEGLEAAGDRRLFRLYPPSLSGYPLGIRRRKAGEDRRYRLPAGRLFR